MGSTGSGNFTDYKDFSGDKHNQGGKSNENDCEKAFRTELEDVDTSEYYISNGKLPGINTPVDIDFNGTRIVALISQQEIGNLPTRFNYLKKCMNEYEYTGIIANVSDTPINSIMINVTPNA